MTAREPSGPVWEFDDARGIRHQGWSETVRDYGGTDVTHGMVTACGQFVMLSGSRLRAAKVLQRPAVSAVCEHRS